VLAKFTEQYSREVVRPPGNADDREPLLTEEVANGLQRRHMEVMPLISFMLPVAFAVTVQIPGLTESSGLAASSRHAGVYWTMNDGGAPVLFAFDRSGASRAKVRVTGAKVFDWEGLSMGPGPVKGRSYVYIGDIGDNALRRKFLTVYRVGEPDLDDAATEQVEAIRLTYPDGAHDAEALMVHPRTGDLYVVIKSRERNGVYKATAPLSTKRTNRLKHIANVDLPGGALLTLVVGRITGGDISPDGRRVVLCDYLQGWEASVPGGEFDQVWKAKWRSIGLGPRGQGEGVAYSSDGRSVLATSEGKEFTLVEVTR
jgi:hypothetical protein